MNTNIVFSAPLQPSPKSRTFGLGSTPTACTQLRREGMARIEPKQQMRLPKNALMLEADRTLMVYENATVWCCGHGGFIPIEMFDADHLQPKGTIGVEQRVDGRSVSVTEQGVEDIANQWLLCGGCNGHKKNADPLTWLAARADFGQKFLDTISDRVVISEGIRTCLRSNRFTKNHKVRYVDREWNILEINKNSERTKIVIGSEGEIPIIIRMYANDGSIVLFPDIDFSNLFVRYQEKDSSGSSSAAEKKCDDYSFDSAKHSDIAFEYRDASGPRMWEGKVDGEKLTAKISDDIRFDFCSGKNEVSLQFLLKDPDQCMQAEIGGITYFRNEEGVLCAEDGIKLGTRAVEYYKSKHLKKIEQKKYVERHVVHPLECEIDQVNLAKYKQGPSREVEKRLRATDKKMVLLKTAIEDQSSYVSSDSDTGLDDTQKQAAAEQAAKEALKAFKTTYSRLKREARGRPVATQPAVATSQTEERHTELSLVSLKQMKP